MPSRILVRPVWFAAMLAAVTTPYWQGAFVAPAVAQHGLADLYRRDLNIGSRSVDRYLFDRHFFHRPSVHPAMNLDRPDAFGTTAYHAFARPERERREQEAQAQRAYRASRMQEGRIGESRRPAPPTRIQGRPNAAPVMQQGSDRFMNTGDRFRTR